MIVRSVTLHEFRNYEDLTLELSDGVNIFVGDNGQGKTNFLEAIGYCATGRSHRTAYDRECIRLGEAEGCIRLRYFDETFARSEQSIEIRLRKSGKKTVLVNRAPVSRINDLYGCFHTVMFSPEDLSLIREGPARRRKFMDMEICQVDKVYMHRLQQYQIVLKERNQLLKEMDPYHPNYDLLAVYDIQFARYAEQIMKRRVLFLQNLEEIAPGIHREITGGKENVHFEYEPHCSFEAEVIEKELRKSFETDLRSKTTGIGPHRDDIVISLGGLDARTYGSQGQKRTAALSMKLAEVILVEKETGKKPVLLLDDVMSELDGNRQKLMVRSIENHQTVITCTGVEDSIRQIRGARLFRVQNGHCSPE